MPNHIIQSMHPGATRVLLGKTTLSVMKIERQGFPES